MKDAIAPGCNVELAVEISTANARGSLAKSLRLIGESGESGKEYEIARLQLDAPIETPVKSSCAEIDLGEGLEEQWYSVELSSVSEDVTLAKSKVAVVGPWLRDQEIVGQSTGRLVLRVKLVAQSKSDVLSELTVRYTYADEDGEHTTQFPVRLTRTPELAVRPAKLQLLQRRDILQLRCFLVGDFDVDTSESVQIMLNLSEGRERVLATQAVRPVSKRIAAVRCEIPAERVPASGGQLVIQFGGDKRVTVPFQVLKE